MAKTTRRRRRRTTKRRRRKRDNRIPIVPTITILSTAMTPAPSGNTIVSRIQNQDWQGLLYDAREKYAGIDANGQIQWHWLFQTYAPIVVSGLISKFVGKFVNKHIAKIPLLGKYIKI